MNQTKTMPNAVLVAAKGFADALRLLSQRYDFVLTNPSFLGRGRMCDELRAFVGRSLLRSPA
ncbi:MAG: hypothetical protein IPK44_16325 [Candidatus Accumulibacter sp.]|uniref:hypothetical protein n=1 Tax=Accumulibacter sp. TaxID=2053492 RepID=UPI00258E6FA8|nr:hypothetical protein [Accumulibacter sp.]MBK8115940.1 hypothetical protein [Accumulibacter sp.]